MSFSRRHFLAAAVGLPLGRLVTTYANQAEQPKIGDNRSDFDAWFGAGTEAGPYVRYQPLAPGRAAYAVVFDSDDNAISLLGDFSVVEGGGIPYSDEEVGQSQFLPTDATSGQKYAFGYNKDAGGYFDFLQWNSASLATTLGANGNVAVLDRKISGMSAMGDFYRHFVETLVGTDRPETHPVIPTANLPGPHSDIQQWVEFNGGNSLMSEAGLILTTPPVPGQWIVDVSGTDQTRTTMNISLDSPISTIEAAEFVAAHLPVSEAVSTTWFHPGPQFGEGFRIHQFLDAVTNTTYLSAQKVVGDEETGTVDRIYLVPADR